MIKKIIYIKKLNENKNKKQKIKNKKIKKQKTKIKKNYPNFQNHQIQAFYLLKLLVKVMNHSNIKSIIKIMITFTLKKKLLNKM